MLVSYGLHAIFQKSRLSLCFCEIFLSTPWLWPLKTCRLVPTSHPRVIKCWGFPSTKSYPSCDRTKMTISLCPDSSHHKLPKRNMGLQDCSLGFYDRIQGKWEGERGSSCRWRGILKQEVKEKFPSGRATSGPCGTGQMDLQLPLPSLEPWHGLLQSLGKGAPISNWSAQIRHF